VENPHEWAKPVEDALEICARWEFPWYNSQCDNIGRIRSITAESQTAKWVEMD